MKAVVVLFALLLAVASARPKNYKNNNRCIGMTDGTRFLHLQYCNNYVECYNEEEIVKKCPAGTFLDAISIECSEKPLVFCPQPPRETTTEKIPTTTTTTTRKPTTTTTTTLKPLTTTTKKPITSTTTVKPTTTTTRSTTTSEPTTTTTTSTAIPSTTLPPTPTCNSQFELDCSMYWSCGTGEPILESCFDGYIYYEPFRVCLPGDKRTCELYHV